MVIPQYSLAWDAYQKNICSGLGALQERGEFVDMTLAADGHYVQVHRMVMSLISPYIKDLISSADCPHPVIFLNNISYQTLCSILEYVYTGQVSVCKDSLGDLIQAGKALCIKGLIDMVDACSADTGENNLATLEEVDSADIHDNNSISYTEEHIEENVELRQSETETVLNETNDTIEESYLEEKPAKTPRVKSRVSSGRKSAVIDSQIQYTMSNQGSLQMVLNRYVYNVRYMYKNSNRRMWRCIFYPKQLRCPAYVITENDDIVERCCTHNHPFHDKSIMRKVREGRVFSILKDAQLQTEILKRSKRSTVTPDE